MIYVYVRTQDLLESAAAVRAAAAAAGLGPEVTGTNGQGADMYGQVRRSGFYIIHSM
jgi:hypothetical protein